MPDRLIPQSVLISVLPLLLSLPFPPSSPLPHHPPVSSHPTLLPGPFIKSYKRKPLSGSHTTQAQHPTHADSSPDGARQQLVLVMELQGLHRSVRFSPHGGEKEQMWNLNHRLETYLNRVKLLDEENAALAKEVQALRRSHHEDLPRRKGLEEELQHARQKVDMIWKERIYAEVEVGRLTKELQTLDLQLQRESQARIEAKTKADQSRRELEEERRAQMWLREKVNQLEHEMKSLIQTHQEGVAHLEATLMQSRATAHTVRPAYQAPNVLELGQEYSRRTTQAWQKATEAYQGQLARLEESVNEAWKRLAQVNHEKNESLLKLQSLDKEMTGLREVKVHLEKTVDQQRESHCQDMQQLQVSAR